MGKFYAVGVGCGDPMDMTLKAKQVLESVDVIVAPIKAEGATSSAYAIAAQGADCTGAESMEIIFPMRAHKDYREYLQSGTLDALYGQLEQGKNVAMVTLGDVSIYSTAAYVRQLVESKGFETEVVAGVTSFCAGAARAKVSLCENGQSLCVLPGVQDQKEILQVLNNFDTVVILKAGKILKWLLPVLEEYHLLENTVMLRNVGREDEYIGVPVLEEYSYFTTLLIRKGNG